MTYGTQQVIMPNISTKLIINTLHQLILSIHEQLCISLQVVFTWSRLMPSGAHIHRTCKMRSDRSDVTFLIVVIISLLIVWNLFRKWAKPIPIKIRCISGIFYSVQQCLPKFALGQGGFPPSTYPSSPSHQQHAIIHITLNLKTDRYHSHGNLRKGQK